MLLIPSHDFRGPTLPLTSCGILSKHFTSHSFSACFKYSEIAAPPVLGHPRIQSRKHIHRCHGVWGLRTYSSWSKLGPVLKC